MSARKAARATRRSRGGGPRGGFTGGGHRGGGGHGPSAGWPTGEHSAITPAGEYEQVGKLLSGLARQRGWRLVAARVAVVVILLIIAAILSAALFAG